MALAGSRPAASSAASNLSMLTVTCTVRGRARESSCCCCAMVATMVMLRASRDEERQRNSETAKVRNSETAKERNPSLGARDSTPDLALASQVAIFVPRSPLGFFLFPPPRSWCVSRSYSVAHRASRSIVVHRAAPRAYRICHIRCVACRLCWA